ncbi:MAG TPA: ferric reductase-like transmembrane domain-containing protein [Noviherbaspirillum sp.]
MKTILAGLLSLVTLAWGLDLLAAPLPPGVSLWWAIRQEALYLTGLSSIVLMSLAMILATRPVWLERPLGGMDRIYRMHKWAGILGISLAAAHWLVEMSDDILKALIGRTGRLPKENHVGLLEALRDLAEEMGEWAIYALLAMLVLTLWKRFPYLVWRYVHRVMPVLYLMLAFHAALLSPSDYWMQPVGLLLAVFLAGGTIASILSLMGAIGKRRLVEGTVVSVKRTAADVTEVACRLGDAWRGHRPGQFAFITFDRLEGPHPFTIACADKGDNTISFQIKALGDYTRVLADRLIPGQAVQVEGPYGRFDLSRRSKRAQQIWIAGGIGVTPFLAWLESMQQNPESAPVADLHYCTRDREQDAFVGRLEALCATLPSIRLHVHGARQGEAISAETLISDEKPRKPAEIWFCGPQGLADKLVDGLRTSWKGRFRFHQEAFEMR